jgi:methionyl aminopeptidase
MKYDKNFVKAMQNIGKKAAFVLTETAKHASAGTTLNDLDLLARDLSLSQGVESACLGYKGYPKYTCISVNDVMCHGLPDDTKLKPGDVVNIDVTVKDKDGHHGDTSLSFVVAGETDLAKLEINKLLVAAAKDARDAGIRAVRPYGTTGEIGFYTANNVALYKGKFDLVDEIGGHGIGKEFHMAPFIPSFGNWGTGDVLRPWTCITVEPILVIGSPKFKTERIPGSEIQIFKTVDGLPAAQFEHTVLITDKGYEILTEI